MNSATWDYSSIKQAAKQHGCTVKDLIALAPQNDPFYVGTQTDKENGTWFADLWQQFGYGTGVHLRRMHYQVISQDPPVTMPNGKPYENTETCWDFIASASQSARYLNMVSPDAFVDRRNPEPHTFALDDTATPQLFVWNESTADDLTLPALPDLPAYKLFNYAGQQLYHVEVWCEKSTMNDVLLPLCEQYGVNLVTGVGEMSITATLAAVQRIQQRGKPARLLYISDFDPAGRSMPVAVSRKIEYFVQQCDTPLDIKLVPIVLTPEQCAMYELPRTPIKETERRAARFEARFGTGATELDALEALHPGTLYDVVKQFITHYYDDTLRQRVSSARWQLERKLNNTRQAIIEQHHDTITEITDEYAALCAEFTDRAQAIQERMSAEWQAISDELEAAAPSIELYPVPQASMANEMSGILYSSKRNYLTQINAYRHFQGRDMLRLDSHKLLTN